MVKSKLRGNTIHHNKEDNQWHYDNGDLVAKTYTSVPCGNCNCHSTEEGHDACLGTLIGVMNACCGHGNVKEAYVQFLDGECIRGEDAVIVQNILKKYRGEIK